MVWKTFGEKGGGGLNFSTVWKLFFHGVENLDYFFPWCGKVEWLFSWRWMMGLSGRL